MKKAHAMLFKLSQQVENGGANCEDSKRFCLYWKGSRTTKARERKISSPDGFMKDTSGFVYSTTFDNNSKKGLFQVKWGGTQLS